MFAKCLILWKHFLKLGSLFSEGFCLRQVNIKIANTSHIVYSSSIQEELAAPCISSGLWEKYSWAHKQTQSFPIDLLHTGKQCKTINIHQYFSKAVSKRRGKTLLRFSIRSMKTLNLYMSKHYSLTSSWFICCSK